MRLKSDSNIPIRIATGTRIRLVSFDNRASAPLDCNPSENYWRLIGSTGIVVAQQEDYGAHVSKDRVLVKFDPDVKSMGLHCHNQVPNSLWVQTSDLEAKSEI